MCIRQPICGGNVLRSNHSLIDVIRPGHQVVLRDSVVVKEKPPAKYSYSFLRKAVLNRSEIVNDRVMEIWVGSIV